MKKIAKMLWKGKITVLAVVVALMLVAAAPALAKHHKPSPPPVAGGGGGTETTAKVRYGDSVQVPKSGPVVRDSFAYCQSGEKFLSGGHTVTDDPSDPPEPNQSGVWDTFTIEGNPVTDTSNTVPAIPVDGGTPIGWHAEVKNNSAHTANKNVLLRAYAVCES